MRRATLAATLALLVVLIGAVPAAASNDPHRIPYPNGPFDLPADFCGFAIHVETPFDHAAITEQVLSDGTVIDAVSGGVFLTMTNTENDASITVNASGPGVFTIKPYVSITGEFRGRGFLYATNLTAFGFPSNVVAVAGPVTIAQDFGTLDFTSVAGGPRVITDICAALE